jgi:hypothetical protein
VYSPPPPNLPISRSGLLPAARYVHSWSLISPLFLSFFLMFLASSPISLLHILIFLDQHLTCFSWPVVASLLWDCYVIPSKGNCNQIIRSSASDINSFHILPSDDSSSLCLEPRGMSPSDNLKIIKCLPRLMSWLLSDISIFLEKL